MAITMDCALSNSLNSALYIIIGIDPESYIGQYDTVICW